jgi:hypothetical protein
MVRENSAQCGLPRIEDGIYFRRQEFVCLYLLPLYIIFNAKFVGKDPLEETVGTRSSAIGNGSHTEQGNGEFKATRILIVPQASLRMLKIRGKIWKKSWIVNWV